VKHRCDSSRNLPRSVPQSSSFFTERFPNEGNACLLVIILKPQIFIQAHSPALSLRRRHEKPLSFRISSPLNFPLTFFFCLSSPPPFLRDYQIFTFSSPFPTLTLAILLMRGGSQCNLVGSLPPLSPGPFFLLRAFRRGVFPP